MSEVKLTRKDYASDQEVKWCPGCGDYAILASVQTAMAQMGVVREKTVVVSGIGCSSRFPYYMNTYGLHSIHGRAPGFATGMKLQNPELNIWLITGDGDGLSIGGNHLSHVIRRNLDINIILFNNEIYGLTKGQYSPTSHQGTKTKSSPLGSADRPYLPSQFALGARGTFFARTIDTDPKHMADTFKSAQGHRGTSLVEVLQNCVIFNDEVHKSYTHKDERDEHTVRLEEGKPLIFGKNKDKALAIKNHGLIVTTDLNDPHIIIHDSSNEFLSQLLSLIPVGGPLPLPLGVLRCLADTTFDQAVREQNQSFTQKKGPGRVHDLLYGHGTWDVT